MNLRQNTKCNVKIKYLAYGHKIYQYLPMVHIILSNKKENIFSTIALVDSGATSTFIPLQIAELLEIELKEQNNDVSSAGGRFSSYITKINRMFIINGSTKLAKFKNPVIRVPIKDEGIPFVILGRDSIFQKFDIKFQESKQQLQLRKRKK